MLDRRAVREQGRWVRLLQRRDGGRRVAHGILDARHCRFEWEGARKARYSPPVLPVIRIRAASDLGWKDRGLDPVGLGAAATSSVPSNPASRRIDRAGIDPQRGAPALVARFDLDAAPAGAASDDIEREDAAALLGMAGARPSPGDVGRFERAALRRRRQSAQTLLERKRREHACQHDVHLFLPELYCSDETVCGAWQTASLTRAICASNGNDRR